MMNRLKIYEYICPFLGKVGDIAKIQNNKVEHIAYGQFNIVDYGRGCEVLFFPDDRLGTIKLGVIKEITHFNDWFVTLSTSISDGHNTPVLIQFKIDEEE